MLSNRLAVLIDLVVRSIGLRPYTTTQPCHKPERPFPCHTPHLRNHSSINRPDKKNISGGPFPVEFLVDPQLAGSSVQPEDVDVFARGELGFRVLDKVDLSVVTLIGISGGQSCDEVTLMRIIMSKKWGFRVLVAVNSVSGGQSCKEIT